MAVDPGSVRFATLTDDVHGFTASFFRSLLPTLGLDLGREQRIWRGGYVLQEVSSAGVVEGRNAVVAEFLTSTAEWLWFVDSDMGWDPDALERLVEAADPAERPIVGGLCFGYTGIADRIDVAQAVVKKPFPTIFDLAERADDIAFSPRYDYAPNAVQECAATGAAMLLIHRNVLQSIADRFGEVWFDRSRPPGAKRLWGEDTSFCMRARMLGFPTHVHSGVRTSHMKSIFVSETVYVAERQSPPATERIAVLVPVLNRPQNAEPFMRSLMASTGLATVYAACSEDADATAWMDAGATVVKTEGTRFPEKINEAFAASVEPWVFIVGDDVKFHPGWLDQAQDVARRTGAKVVGTNDLGNERVIAGDHGTHLLIRRDYVDELGASWDGPGVVCHEGYHHWFVDDEIVTVAKQREAWAPALGSIVEHLHPLWGKSEDDDTYQLGQRSARNDRKVFVERMAEFGGC